MLLSSPVFQRPRDVKKKRTRRKAHVFCDVMGLNKCIEKRIELLALGTRWLWWRCSGLSMLHPLVAVEEMMGKKIPFLFLFPSLLQRERERADEIQKAVQPEVEAKGRGNGQERRRITCMKCVLRSVRIPLFFPPQFSFLFLSLHFHPLPVLRALVNKQDFVNKQFFLCFKSNKKNTGYYFSSFSRRFGPSKKKND